MINGYIITTANAINDADRLSSAATGWLRLKRYWLGLDLLVWTQCAGINATGGLPTIRLQSVTWHIGDCRTGYRQTYNLGSDHLPVGSSAQRPVSV